MNKALRGLCAYLTGHVAEDEAARFLQSKGFHLIAQNVAGKRGSGANELDLIMSDKKTLVFIEVKKRQDLTRAAEAVNPIVQRRLYRAAELFLAKNPQYENWDCRFDVVLIVPDQAPLHLQNVIEAV